jgi:hypothetical protein
MFTELAAAWVAWVLAFEGPQVVEEPGGRFSRYGVLAKSFSVASSTTLAQARVRAWQEVRFVQKRFPRVARSSPVTALILLDFGWNAGRSTAVSVSARPPHLVFRAVARHYELLGLREGYRQYATGWALRREQIHNLIRRVLSNAKSR